MAIPTGERVRRSGNAEAHSHHPARNSLLALAPPADESQLLDPVQPPPSVARADSPAYDGLSVPAGDGLSAPANGGLSAPVLALLAAAAIFEGYRWLRFIPGSPSVPDAFVFTITAAAITFGLIRPAAWARSGPVRRVARAGACSLVGAALLVPLIGVAVTDQIVGTVSLVLAVAALLGVASREQHRRSGQLGGSDPLH